MSITQQIADARWLYRSEHCRCAICHNPRIGELECHHIAGRGTPQHEVAANFLMICGAFGRGCGAHWQYHHGGLSQPDLHLGHILWAKQDADGLVDLEWLAMLRHRKALTHEPERLPDWYIQRREANR